MKEIKTKVCEECGKIFEKGVTTSKVVWKRRRCCGKECYNNQGRENKICPICNKQFTAIKFAKRIFCSILCKNRSMPDRGGKIINQCEICNKDFIPKKRGELGRKSKFCSKICQGKGKDGEHHWNWKGGVSRDNHRREDPEYKKWRSEVYKRDRWKCKKCGKRENIVAHHIKSYKNYKDLRYVVSNGVTLCRSCHKKVHSSIGMNTRFRKQMNTQVTHKIVTS